MYCTLGVAGITGQQRCSGECDGLDFRHVLLAGQHQLLPQDLQNLRREFRAAERLPRQREVGESRSLHARASAVQGVSAHYGGEDAVALKAALTAAHKYDGLSVVHVPVYCGDDPLGGMGAYGSWNVGNWCEDVQTRYHTQDI